MLCVAAVTLLAWIAIDGPRRQLEARAGAAAAAATGGILLFRTRERECAESSQR